MFKQLKKRGSILTGHSRRKQIINRRDYLLKQRQRIILEQEKIQQEKLQQEKLQQEKLQQEKLRKIKRENYKDEFNEAITFLDKQNIRNNKINYYPTNSKYGYICKKIHVKNNYCNNDLTITLSIKNRVERFKIFLEYYNLYASNIKLVIVESISENMIPTHLIENNKNIRHIIVDIGKKWCLSKLRNYCIYNCKTEFILFSDVDFIFTPKFSKNIEDIINSNIAEKSLVGLPIFESWLTFNDNFTKIVRDKYSGYGAFYLCKLSIIKKFLFNETIQRYGKEERDLQERLNNNNINTIFCNYPEIPIYCLHYSHNNITRK